MKKSKKFISLLLSFIMLLGLTAGIDLSAYASYDNMCSAYNYTFGNTYYGNIAYNNPRDYLKLTLRESGKVTIEFCADVIYELNGGRYTSIALCDTNGETFYIKDVNYNSNRGYCYINESINLNAGTYYFFTYADHNYYIASGNFSVKIDYSPYHTYDNGKVTKVATATTTGVKTYTCTVCGATKTEAIPATGLKTPTLKAKVNANGSFKLSWNKVSGAEKYELYIKQADGSYKLMKTTTGTSFTTGTAAYGKQYTYKMRAVKGNIKSAYSAVVNAKNTKKLQTPSAKATVNANGSFKLSWNKVTGATKYGIYMKQTNGSYKWIKTVTGTSWSTATAQYGKQYSYKILAANNNKSAQTFSNVVNAKNTKKLTTPTLKVSVNKNGSFKLSWGKATGATSYQIYMKQSNGTYKLIKTTSSTSFTTAVAAKGKTYSYKVRAVTSKNKNATSNYSSVVSAKRK